MSNFHSIEVVGGGSETQLQVDENFNYLIWSNQVVKFYFFSHLKMSLAKIKYINCNFIE